MENKNMNENISRENNELVIRIPLTQKGSYTYGDGEWEVQNLIGVWVEKENGMGEGSLSQANYLDYKDDLQEGMPIVMFYEKEELVEVCRKYNIELWEHDYCRNCEETIYGSFSWNDNSEPICSYGCTKK